MYDLVLLRTFVAVAETQSFTRAAELVQRSQPTVSQQIQRLEESAGRILVPPALRPYMDGRELISK